MDILACILEILREHAYELGKNSSHIGYRSRSRACPWLRGRA